MEILVVIDMQKDFIDGVLGTAEAQAVLPKVVERVKAHKGPLLFTRDTHGEDYLETQEGRHLPVVHCVKGTSGWEIAQPLQPFVANPPYDKPTFGGGELATYIKDLQGDVAENQLTITLIGLCTDICVISNAMILKPAFPEATIVVEGNCCAGVTPESHETALKAMGMCQITVK